ncbi:nickel-dependent hydrogenase large subunit [Magnetospirillum sp. UT-4]|uniref:nickel-dependent hydrogenase large subunit n=1 Tax=Magnetospirillum sp. UT-4 TaxID=2681467 RepID=UPI00137ECA34|nr:nickel-dependent hydrogenase large subunit [Magnetospirillum sp. UT-4]CAA7614302.1 Hydrogenase expression/formation protein HupK [Magnetospirillum sp. UT-4]
MLPESRIHIALRTSAGRVAAVEVRSTRMVEAAGRFAGRRPDEVLAILPLVFSLCGTAQALAAVAAVEDAAGIVPSRPQIAARRLLLLAETVSEHGLGIARDWPALVGEAADLGGAKTLKTAMAAIRPALYPAGDWAVPGGGGLVPDRFRVQDALADAGAALVAMTGFRLCHAIDDSEAFAAVLAHPSTAPARLLAGLGEDAGFGAQPFEPMPAGGPADLNARLAADADGGFLARPDMGGRVPETGPLARQAMLPPVAALLARHGTGVLPRLAARLADAASALREMATLVQDLAETPPSPIRPAQGSGLGVVEAARGLLAHRIELEDGLVSRYQILAPTEWNFHPGGALARGLAGAIADDRLEARARLLVHALDPCVACTVAVD